MNKNSKIIIIGNSNIIFDTAYSYLKSNNYNNVKKLHISNSINYSFTKAKKLFESFFPEYIYLTGGMTGGINFNIQKPQELMNNNLIAEIITMQLAQKFKIKKLIYFGSSCMYPKEMSRNAKPNMLFQGVLEPSNLHYATSKLSGMVLCDAYNKQFKTNFLSLIPSNPFGPFDDFSDTNSHVIPGLINRIHKAKKNKKNKVIIWGSGKPIRDFIFAEEVINASIKIMKSKKKFDIINVSSRDIYSIKDLVMIIKDIIKFEGKIVFDQSKPDGTVFKSLNNSDLKKLGWKKKYLFRDSLIKTYKWYLKSKYND